MADGDTELTAEDLQRDGADAGLDTGYRSGCMSQVLDAVREQRAAVRRFAESAVDVDETLTAQPYRLEEGTP